MAGGGVGEAMLISAAVGAGTGAAGSAIQGGDPLKGALMGGVTGAIGGGVMGAMAPGAAGVTSASQAGAAGTGATEVGKEALFKAAQSNIDPGILNSMSQNAVMNAPVLNTGIGTTTAGINPASVPTLPSPNAFGYSPLTNTQLGILGAGTALQGAMQADQSRYGIPSDLNEPYDGPLSRFSYDPNRFRPSLAPGYAAGGGITDLDVYGSNSISPDSYLKQPVTMMNSGGISSLGGYSDGGRMLKGPGDGMSDNIPATIAGKQPARLADGEFVIPADVVSHLGNGSTDAGAKQLYNMMNKVRKARTGNPKQGREINPKKYLRA